jgi:hypothetical protein
MKISNARQFCMYELTWRGGRMRDLCNSAISLFLTTALLGFPLGCRRGASDEAIAKDIQGKISADPDTKDSQVNVAAKD